MDTNDKTKVVLVVNNPTKPSGDAVIPPKGPPLRLARPDEAARIERMQEAIRQAPPGIHRLAAKIEGNFLLQRILRQALAKANAIPLTDEDDCNGENAG